MKRPFIYGAMSLMVALMTALIGFWCIPIVIGALLVIQNKSNQSPIVQYKMSVILVIGFFAMIYFLLFIHRYETLSYALQQSDDFAGRGIIKEMNKNEYSTVYSLNPWWDKEGHRHDFELRISSSSRGSIGDIVSFEGEVRDSMKGYNEGAFNLAQYYREKGIVGLLKGDLFVDYRSRRYAARRYFYDLREEHYTRLTGLMPQRHMAVLANLFLGKSEVAEDDRELFQNSGTVHILAISGLHITLIAGMLFGLINKVTHNQQVNACIVLGVIIAYAVYTGVHISTVRATLMIGIFLGHMIFYRKYDRHIAIGVAFVAMVLVNPLQVTSPGFLLSFGAVLSIFYIVPQLDSGFLHSDNSIIASLRVLLGIQIGLTPVIAYFYQQIPLYSFIGNLLILPVIAFVIAFGAASVFLSYVNITVASIAAGNVFWLINYMLEAVTWISHLPLNTVSVSAIDPWMIIAYYSTLILWSTGFKSAGKAGMGILVFVVIVINLIPEETLVIDMMDVGNGDAVFVRYDGQTILIDGGGQVAIEGDNVGKSVLHPYLKYHGIKKIDTVIISHSDFDHIYGIIELMSLVTIDRIVMASVYQEYEDEWAVRIKKLAAYNGVEVIYAQGGDKLTAGPLELLYLYPVDAAVQRDNNRHSSVLKLSLDAFDMLFTGDAYAEDEEVLMDLHEMSLQGIEVLKVAHHGSRTSTSAKFIEMVSPQISLVSVGRDNIYGHPATAVRERLYEHSDNVYMTKDDGQIKLTYDEGQIKVKTFLD